MDIITTKCKCTSVVRRNWDSTRKCFRYTAIMEPISDSDDSDIFRSLDMFVKDFRCPLRDEKLRVGDNAKLAANDDDSEEKKTAWDAIVASKLVNKETNVLHVSLSVSELTDGLYKSYTLKISDEQQYEVASREISALQDIEGAIRRTKNQVLRACRGEESEE